MNLSDLNNSSAKKTARKRIGRGNGSGWGTTAGRGNKGARSRSGWKAKLHFEGGQLPVIRRLPKRGFSNALWKKSFAIVNLGSLNVFEDGTVVTPELLLEKRIILQIGDGLRVLGQGALERKLEVRAHGFSAKAKESIGAAGGSVTLLETKRAKALGSIKDKRFKGKRRARQAKAGKPVKTAIKS
jgi:large subunit ribosomal protein L15